MTTEIETATATQEILMVPENQKDHPQHLLMTMKIKDEQTRQKVQAAITAFVNHPQETEENKVGTRRSKDKRDKYKIFTETM